MRISNIHCFALVLLLCATHALAIIVGSNTSVSKNAFVTFPAKDIDNEIRMFATMNEGFALASVSTKCLFGSCFPVRKRLELNRGTLTLSTDLKIENIGQLINWGDVRATTGEIRIVALPSNLTTLGSASSGPFIFENIELHIAGNVVFPSVFQFKGDCKIVGAGKCLDLSATGGFIVSTNGSLALQNITIKNVGTNDIRCIDNTGKIILDNATWILDNDYTFTRGAIQFKNANSILGKYIFAYHSQMTSTVLQNSRLTLAQNLTFSYDPLMGSKKFIDESSELILNRSTIHTTTVGMQLKKGRMIVKNDSKMESEILVGEDDDLTDEGITLGDGLDALNDFYVQILSGVTLDIVQGSLIIRNLDPNTFSFINAYATLHMSSFTSLLVYHNAFFTIGRIIFEDQSVLGIVPGNTFVASISPFGSLERLALTP